MTIYNPANPLHQHLFTTQGTGESIEMLFGPNILAQDLSHIGAMNIETGLLAPVDTKKIWLDTNTSPAIVKVFDGTLWGAMDNESFLSHLHNSAKHNFTAIVVPTATDDSASGYGVSSFWWDSVNNKLFTCFDSTVGAALWIDLSTATANEVSCTAPGNGIIATTVQAALNELAAEKLAIDGTIAMTGNLNMGSQVINFVADPIIDSDATNKGYVDNLVQGVNWKESVIAGTTVAGTLSSDFENGDSIDGIVLATGNRILIKNQASGVENGIYIVQATGIPIRADDYAIATAVASTSVFVESGTINGDVGFTQTSDSGVDVVGTNTLQFVSFASLNPASAFKNIVPTVGATIDADITNDTLSMVSSDSSIKVTGSGNQLNFQMDLSSVSNGTSIAAGDSILIYDTSSNSLKRVFWSDANKNLIIAQGSSS